MSTTAHWEPIKPPDPPAGSLYRLKQLLFDDFNQVIGAEVIILAGSRTHGVLEGLHAGMDLADGDDRQEVRRILDAIEKHGGVRVWIDE